MAVVKDPKKPGSIQNSTSNGARRPSSHDDEPGRFSMMGIRTNLVHSWGVKIILGFLILIFSVSIGSITGLLGGGPTPDASRRPLGGGPDPVAQIGDETVPRQRFQLALANTIRQNEQFGMAPPPEQALSTRQSTLQQMVEETGRYVETKRRGLTASDEEIDKKINEFIDEQLKPGPGRSEAAIRREIEGSGKTLEQAREEARANYDRDAVARLVVLDKLEKQIKDENKVSEDDYKRSMTRLKLRQIKITPKTPAPTEKDFAAAQEKARAEAKTRADKLAASLKNANLQQFVAAVQKNGDDLSTKTKGGDLGAKMPAELPLAANVRDAVVKSTGSVVGPIQDETTKDFYIFFVENRKLELPKDYAKKKAEYLKTFEEQKDQEAWSKFQDDLKKTQQPEIYDPALQALKIQTEQVWTAQGDEQKRLRQEALDKYTEALNYASPAEATAIHYQMAQLYRDMQQPDKQMESLKKAMESGNAKQARLEYARLLREQKKNAEALKELAALSKQLDENPTQPSPFGGGSPDDGLRYQIASEYEVLGKQDLANKEKQKIKPPQAPQGLNFGGGANQTITLPGR